MDIALIILAFIVACGLGILWDYYKPARFRTTYRTINKNHTGDAGPSSSGDGDCGGGGD